MLVNRKLPCRFDTHYDLADLTRNDINDLFVLLWKTVHCFHCCCGFFLYCI